MNAKTVNTRAKRGLTDSPDRFVEAAETILVTKGLAGVTARAIAAQVSCSPGMVYHLFADMDDLIGALNLKTLGRLDEALSKAHRGGPRQTLLSLASVYLDFASTHTALWRALFEYRLPPNRQVPDDFRLAMTTTFARLSTPLSALVGGDDAERLELTARSLFSAVHGIVYLGIEEKLVAVPRTKLEYMVRSFVETFIAGIAREVIGGARASWTELAESVSGRLTDLS